MWEICLFKPKRANKVGYQSPQKVSFVHCDIRQVWKKKGVFGTIFSMESEQCNIWCEQHGNVILIELNHYSTNEDLLVL